MAISFLKIKRTRERAPNDVPFTLNFDVILLGFGSISIAALAGKKTTIFFSSGLMKNKAHSFALSTLSAITTTMKMHSSAHKQPFSNERYLVLSVFRIQCRLPKWSHCVFDACCLFLSQRHKIQSLSSRGLFSSLFLNINIYLFCFAFVKSIRSDAKKCKSSSLWMNVIAARSLARHGHETK